MLYNYAILNNNGINQKAPGQDDSDDDVSLPHVKWMIEIFDRHYKLICWFESLEQSYGGTHTFWKTNLRIVSSPAHIFIFVF